MCADADQWTRANADLWTHAVHVTLTSIVCTVLMPSISNEAGTWS